MNKVQSLIREVSSLDDQSFEALINHLDRAGRSEPLGDEFEALEEALRSTRSRVLQRRASSAGEPMWLIQQRKRLGVAMGVMGPWVVWLRPEDLTPELWRIDALQPPSADLRVPLAALV